MIGFYAEFPIVEPEPTGFTLISEYREGYQYGFFRVDGQGSVVPDYSTVIPDGPPKTPGAQGVIERISWGIPTSQLILEFRGPYASAAALPFTKVHVGSQTFLVSSVLPDYDSYGSYVSLVWLGVTVNPLPSGAVPIRFEL